MKKLILGNTLVIGLFWAACNPSSSEQATYHNLEQSATYPFSDSVQADTFKVAVVGSSTKDMLFLFTITSYKGIEIYRQEIKANELLKNYLATADMKKESDKINFLKEEIAYFFEEHHFLEPAITSDDKPDNNVPDEDFYEELKQSGLNGFEYRIAKDQSIYIGWSASTQQVKVYYQCC